MSVGSPLLKDAVTVAPVAALLQLSFTLAETVVGLPFVATNEVKGEVMVTEREEGVHEPTVVYDWYCNAIGLPAKSFTPVLSVTVYSVELFWPVVVKTAELPLHDVLAHVPVLGLIVMFVVFTVVQSMPEASVQFIVTGLFRGIPVALFAGVVLETTGATVSIVIVEPELSLPVLEQVVVISVSVPVSV